MPCLTRNSFANSLLPSSCAPIFDGPITGISFKLLSFLKKSYIPFTNGSSGPTTTIVMFSSSTNVFIASKSDGFKFTFCAILAVPAFPGATKSFEHSGLCSIFQAKACSLPPEPSSKIVIR